VNLFENVIKLDLFFTFMRFYFHAIKKSCVKVTLRIQSMFFCFSWAAIRHYSRTTHAVAAGLLWLQGCCGCWTIVAAGFLWLLCRLLDRCGCWAAMATEVLWLLGSCGCWAPVATGQMGRSGCCWADVAAVAAGLLWLLECCGC
jgi:hypothetical protein